MGLSSFDQHFSGLLKNIWAKLVAVSTRYKGNEYSDVQTTP